MRKQITQLLLLGMAMTSLAGCGSSKQTETTAQATTTAQNVEATTVAKETEAATEAVLAEPVTLTIGVSSLTKGFPDNKEDDFVYQTILDRTGVGVEFVVIDDYYTALNVRLTGNSAPDLFTADSEHMQVYAAQGLLKDLTEIKDDLKPVFDYLGPEHDNYTMYVGDSLYALPQANAISSCYYSLYVRQDYLDEYGLKAPTTVDELYDYCMTVKERIRLAVVRPFHLPVMSGKP